MLHQRDDASAETGRSGRDLSPTLNDLSRETNRRGRGGAPLRISGAFGPTHNQGLRRTEGGPALQQGVFGFAFDVAAAGAAVAVDRRQVLTGHRVEDEDRPLKATIAIGSLIASWDVAATEVHEECFAAMVDS